MRDIDRREMGYLLDGLDRKANDIQSKAADLRDDPDMTTRHLAIVDQASRLASDVLKLLDRALEE